eukprot:TRINITY_DN744_c0_g1_i1.p1 TRINITY_DN744_c0_g1~~TRINITY_DN744_c0_g1_i1.p1  ORF type:complete len:309 (+),score=108.20 TRINITY_DN744_c0_g1_i1:174-1100(+)
MSGDDGNSGKESSVMLDIEDRDSNISRLVANQDKWRGLEWFLLSFGFFSYSLVALFIGYRTHNFDSVTMGVILMITTPILIIAGFISRRRRVKLECEQLFEGEIGRWTCDGNSWSNFAHHEWSIFDVEYCYSFGICCIMGIVPSSLFIYNAGIGGILWAFTISATAMIYMMVKTYIVIKRRNEEFDSTVHNCILSRESFYWNGRMFPLQKLDAEHPESGRFSLLSSKIYKLEVEDVEMNVMSMSLRKSEGMEKITFNIPIPNQLISQVSEWMVTFATYQSHSGIRSNSVMETEPLLEKEEENKEECIQ